MPEQLCRVCGAWTPVYRDSCAVCGRSLLPVLPLMPERHREREGLDAETVLDVAGEERR